MKRKHYFSCVQSTGRRLLAWALLLATGLLTACLQDELADGNGTSLPEGKYPLQIGSVTLTAEVDGQPWSTGAPQTRVSENPDGNSSHWDGGEIITVQLSDKQTTTYEVNTDGTLTLTGEQLYWTKRTDNVTAWYPGSGTIDLSNQSDRLAYVLKATTENASYDAPVSLSFGHALAKVRVKLTGDKQNDVIDVKIKTYTSCTLGEDGTLSTGDTEDFIPMVKASYEGKTCWEANVVPGQGITQIKVNGNESTLSTPLTPLGAKVNTITINVGKAAMNPDDLPNPINSDEEYIISGNGTKGITIIGGSPTIRFKEVSLNSETAIEITGGSPKLVFEGTNSLESTDGGKGAISLSCGASVDISGNGTLSLKANTADYYGGGWYEGAILGSAGSATCGDISISGVTLNITAKSYNAAIGSGERGSSCGNIVITDASVHITGCNGGAGIGTSMTHGGTSSCGDIRIKNSDIEIAYGNFYAYQGAAIGCAAPVTETYQNTVKGIYITLKEGQTKDDFLSKLTTTSATGSDKVGQGYMENSGKSGTITNGIHWYNADGTVL